MSCKGAGASGGHVYSTGLEAMRDGDGAPERDGGKREGGKRERGEERERGGKREREGVGLARVKGVPAPHRWETHSTSSLSGTMDTDSWRSPTSFSNAPRCRRRCVCQCMPPAPAPTPIRSISTATPAMAPPHEHESVPGASPHAAAAAAAAVAVAVAVPPAPAPVPTPSGLPVAFVRVPLARVPLALSGGTVLGTAAVAGCRGLVGAGTSAGAAVQLQTAPAPLLATVGVGAAVAVAVGAAAEGLHPATTTTAGGHATAAGHTHDCVPFARPGVKSKPPRCCQAWCVLVCVGGG